VKVEEIPLSEIIPYEKNPRHNEKAVDVVAKSIKEFGFKVPIILDAHNVIIAGHTRLKAAIKLGLQTAPVLWADDLTPEQVKAFRIMDNKTHEYSTWDFDKLKLELGDLKEFGMAELSGFSEAELNKLIPQEFANEILPDSTKPKYEIQTGEIWQLGNHKLMCGDCTTEGVNKLFGEKVINMILSDPPYGVDYSAKNEFLNSIAKGNRNQTPIEGDKDVEIRVLISDFLKKAKLAEQNTIYIFTSGKNIASVIYGFEDANCHYSQDLKWIKNNHVLGRLDYNPKSENILYGWKGKHEFYGGFQTDVLFFDKPNNSDLHPTMKPINLLSELLKHGSRENGIVYDGFGGSGSTLIACEQTNRICFMMEIDPKYCSVIIERWENLTGKKAEKIQ
jgi:site-specific DNA-methyltransferase (adenine-specific)